MKLDAKTIIALIAAILSAYAQYNADSVGRAQLWSAHRIEADAKGRGRRFKDIERRLDELDARMHDRLGVWRP